MSGSAYPHGHMSSFSIPASVDYEPLTTDLTFSATVQRVDIQVTVLDDEAVEFGEGFQVTIVNAEPHAQFVTLKPANVVVTILDDVDSMLT